MAADMTIDIFASASYGQLALARLSPVSENFRLFEAGWLGDQPKDMTVMEVKGADFRPAKSGPNKGKLAIMIPGTVRTVHLTREEVRAAAPVVAQ